MATKQFYATGSFKYANRMLKAGDPVEMEGPVSRLYIHLGKIVEEKPRAPAPVVEEAVAEFVKDANDPNSVPRRKRTARRKK